MPNLLMIITDAGFDALVDAQGGGSDNIRISYMGLTDTPFVMARTLTALPGQFKTLESFAGQTIADNIIHLSAYDRSNESYDVTGFGLYLDDDTLFAAFSSDSDPILTKAELAWSLFSHDITFDNISTADIDFGDASFLNPPASESVKGVAEIADDGEADAGLDDERIMTPKKVKRVIDAFSTLVDDALAAIGNAIDDILGRTITGTGLVSGGGDLSADRELNVTAATPADFLAGTASDLALTPASLGPVTKLIAQNGYITIPTADPANTILVQWGRFTANSKALTAVNFPIPFTECFVAVPSGTGETDTSGQDMGTAVRTSTIGPAGFSVFSQQDVNDPMNYIAIGRIDLS